MAIPREQQPEERRVNPRLEAGHLVVHGDPDSSEFETPLGMAVTLDLNEFGLKVQCNQPMPLGELFRFSVALGDDLLDATGEVVHISRVLNGTFEMGIEFVDITPGNVSMIRDYVRSHMGQ